MKYRMMRWSCAPYDGRDRGKRMNTYYWFDCLRWILMAMVSDSEITSIINTKSESVLNSFETLTRDLKASEGNDL